MLSVVIPARNEEKVLGATLDSLNLALGGRLEFEIVVMDHNSEDDTAKIAEAAGARVVSVKASSIGELRNKGVASTAGEVLVFLDADVTVTPDWGERLSEIEPEIRTGTRLITGSWCRVPPDESWIERHWFQARKQSQSHLGSGHLIIGRTLFEECSGFDERLKTGEDYDLCQRALSRGGRIRSDPRLVAIHHGFPKTVPAFFRRELWHGMGDFSSGQAFSQSKVAMASVLFFLFHILSLFGILFQIPVLAIGPLVGISLILFITIFRRFGKSEGRISWVRVAFLSYVYLLGRALSPLAYGMRISSWR